MIALVMKGTCISESTGTGTYSIDTVTASTLILDDTEIRTDSTGTNGTCCTNHADSIDIVLAQSCKMSQIRQIYLCKMFGCLG